ncbi:MAG: hypothetical protein ACXVHV_09535, partial [Methanobacterium sp.]
DPEYVEKLVRLDNLLSSVVTDKPIKFLVKKLQYYYHFFNRLCMIFKDVTGCGKTVREQVEKRTRMYLSAMKNKSKIDPEFKKIVSRLEKYWNGLFYTYEFGYIPSTNNDMEECIKDFKKIWKRITGFYNVNRWINFHGPFAVYLLNFQKNKKGKSPLEMLGIETPDFVTMLQKVSIQTYKNEKLKQIELRESYRVRLRVNQIGIRKFVDHLVQQFDNKENVLKGDDLSS